MLTFLTSPKPFIGHARENQRNAIRSWLAVHPDVEVIIYGDGEGVSEACDEMKVYHVPDIPCSPSGIPYFNGIVEHARIHARHDVQCYLNCDILMTEDLIKAIKLIDFPRYLVIGQRIDLADGVEIDPTNNQWKVDILNFFEINKACLHEPTGMDYFIFPRGMWGGLPPVVIGRGGYDGALVVYCLRNKIPLINATLAFPALHQFHDYTHLPNGNITVFNGEDANNNIMLHNLRHSIPDSADAHWLIKNGTLIQNQIQKDWLRHIELLLRFKFNFSTLSLLVRLCWRIAMATRILRNKSFTKKDVIVENRIIYLDPVNMI